MTGYGPAWHFPATPAAAATVLTALRPYGPRASAGVLALAEQHTATGVARGVLDDGAPEPEYDGAGHVNMPLWAHQRRFVEFGMSAPAICFAVKMGGGKMLSVDTPMPTPTGWTRMGDLRDGDELFDEHGEICCVITAHPVVENAPTYDVKFSDGEVITACGDHLWFTETRADRVTRALARGRGEIEPVTGAVRSTDDIRASLRVGARSLTNHSIPVAGALRLPNVELLVPSYTLGQWLGNGSAVSGQLTVGGVRTAAGYISDGLEVRELLAIDGYRCTPERWSAGAETFTVYKLVGALRALGVLGDKHIPEAYLRASEKQRQALLAGLLDTDGTVCVHGRVQFDSTTRLLAEGVRELVTSLGYRPTWQEHRAVLNGRDHGPSWRVSFTTADPVFHLRRKARAHERRSRAYCAERNRHRYVVAAERIPSVPMRCITVDSPSQLYLAGRGMIPTHNTGGAIALINRVQAGRVLIVCPNKVRRVWVREVRERSSVRWHIEDGTRPKKRGRGWIDLSHPDRIAQANQVLFDCDCGAPVHAIALNYEAMELGVWQRWQPPAQLDLIAYDEAHKLKNRTDRIRRKVKGISKEELKRRAARDLPKWTRSGLSGQWRANTRRAIGLTGTPFPQHPWDIFGMYRALDPGIFGTVWTDFQEEWIEMDRSGTYPKRIKPDKLVEFAARCMSIMYVPKVDLHLPGCSDVLRTVELEPEARRVYDQLDTELWADLSRMLARQRGAARRGGAGEVLDSGGDGELEDGGDGAPAELTAKNILSRLLRLQQLTGGTLRTDPVEGRDGKPVPGPEVRVSTAKSDLLAEVLEEIGCVAAVEGSPQGYEPEPVIVFARFTSDLRAIREVVDAAGLRYGEISGRRVDGLDDDARMAGDRDVVGVQVQAGGTGIDLTRARYVVFYSLGYSVSDYDQARARPYRPGQTRPVVFIHIQAEDTQDEQVYAAIDQRRAAVSEVLRAGGVDPEEVGVIEADPGLAPEVLVDVDSAASAVVLPWEVSVEW